VTHILLGKRGQLGERWLWNQLEILAEEAQQLEPRGSLDPQATWRALAPADNIRELLYLFRLLWTSQTFTTARDSRLDLL
jgi:hypothetical protein